MAVEARHAVRGTAACDAQPDERPWGYGLGYPGWIEPALPAIHGAFNGMNRYLSVPALKMGLGRYMSTPLTGYLMILRTRGRKSGTWRDAPLGYAVIGDAVYCIAGFGERTHWYRNILADSHVEVLLPGRSFSGLAEEVVDDEERLAVLPPLVRSMGLVASGFGLGNPYTQSPVELTRRCEAFPLVRIRATGIAAGPDDPGGRFWIVPVAIAGFLALRWLEGRRRTGGRSGCGRDTGAEGFCPPDR
jgi:deazaflavin-dependent oxidoreductase (nitroreductase family)